MLEKFKKFPVVAQVILCLQLVGDILGIIGLIKLLSMATQLSYVYALTGKDAPGKFTIFLGVIAALLVIGAILYLVTNTNKQSVMIYFGVLIFNLIIGIIMNGFGLATLAGLIFPGIMAYTISQNKEFFGI
jgi:hypothetical protein